MALVVIVLFLMLKGGFLSGIGEKLAFISYDDEELHTDTDGSEEESASCGDARYLTLPIDEKVRDKETYYDYPNDMLAWWFKRDDNHGPSGCDDTLDISEYGAYYLDKNAEAVYEETGEKVIYLTFDCGYENGYTNQILDVLETQDVPACFFVTKTFIRDNPEIAKRMKEEGHQVGNHTVHHPCMPEKSVEEQKSELKECSDFMKSETGYDMDMYFRPPSGEYSEQVLQLAKDMGYKTIFWSMAYLDYDVNNQPGTDYVIDHFAKYYHPGAIPLIHNVSSSNAQALDTVLTNLEKEGYEFRSLNEMKFE